MKTCVKCGKEKLPSQFRLSAKSDNHKYRRPECIECEKKYSKEKYKIFKKIKSIEIGNKCACCGRSDKKLVLDHCHVTGKFRGFICQNCNLGIGRLGDNIEGIKMALKYLKKNNK
jgi:hypothetical protein